LPVPQAKSFKDKLAPATTKKLLALDDGGIRGAVTIEYLVKIEDELRKALKEGDDFALADYFDYVAGTSPGAIIATCVALGMKAREIQTFYRNSGRAMFDRAWLIQQYRYKYSDQALAKMLRDAIDGKSGEVETKLGSEKLRMLLMVVLRNAWTRPVTGVRCIRRAPASRSRRGSEELLQLEKTALL
jgi:hypothetical protein